MYSTRLINFLIVALSIFSIAQATFAAATVTARNEHEIVRRQGRGGDDDRSSVTADASPSDPPLSSTPDTSSPPGPTSPTDTPSPTDTGTSKPPPSSTPTSSKTSNSPTPTKTSSTTKETTSSSSSTSSIPISTITHVVTATNPDGSRTTYTTQSTSTPTAGLQDGSSKGTSSGMSKSTRNIVIGVVVGVGGAIVLGGIALVAWRIWGRKKNQAENDGLMDYNGGYSNPVEKTEPTASPSGRSPFQSTLESYHAPTQVNTASNF